MLIAVCLLQSSVISVDVSSDLDVVVSGGVDGKVIVHSLRGGRFLHSTRGNGMVRSVALLTMYCVVCAVR